MTDTPWHMAVLIPARNEESLLPRCVRSVVRACDRLPFHVTTHIVVTSDASTDATVQIAEAMLRACNGTVAEIFAENVGVARAHAARLALSRYGGDLSQCWLANTDADCEVPETWLLDQLQLAEQGITAVAGIVGVDCFLEHRDDVASRFKSSYRINEDGTHPHVHGANLGVRADVYLSSGGWSPLKTAEDHDLWLRLCSGSTHRSDARLQVETSGRRIGRAPLGFAGALAAHNEHILEEGVA